MTCEGIETDIELLSNMNLVDTNILIEYFDKDNQTVALFEKWVNENKLRLSCIVVAEFLVRATNEQQRLLWKLVQDSPIVYLDKLILIKTADIRRGLLLKKKRVVLLDCFIAATAIVNGWTLITRNARDFRSISELKLKVI